MSQSNNAADNAVWYNARHGDAAAMNQLGVWYYSGNKVQRDYSQAYDWWHKGALLGNVKAIANLGVCYQYGRGVKADSVTAIQLYLAAIQNGQMELLEQRKANVGSNPFDAMLVGTCYERGVGTDRDIKQAAEMFTIAANQGSVDGMRRAAEALLASNNTIEALKMYDMGAERGDVISMYMAGKMRMGGMGVATNRQQAIPLIKKAASASLPEAQAYLGTMFLNGEGVERSIENATQLLSAACAAGDQTAMWQYGQLLRGKGDYDRALFWMAMGAQATGQGQFNLMYRALPKNDPFKLYIDGMREYYKGNYHQAVQIFKNMEQNNGVEGRVMEAVVMADASNPKGDAKKGAKNLTKLTSVSPQAAYVLAGLYMDGRGVNKDTQKAISLYREAANAGYGPAQDVIANIYYEGKITTKDLREAIKYYERALAQRSLSATGVKHLKEIYSVDNTSKAAKISAYDTTDPMRTVLTNM